MDIEPKTRREHFLARAAGDENALALQPKTREEHLLQNLIDAIEEGGGSGSVTSVNGKTGAVVLTASDVGAAAAETVVTVEGSTPTIEPQANTIYKCGELGSLTISNPPATGTYVIKFTSGSTATTTTIPASIIFPEAFAAEANTRYEINVEDGYAVAVGWPVS